MRIYTYSRYHTCSFSWTITVSCLCSETCVAGCVVDDDDGGTNSYENAIGRNSLIRQKYCPPNIIAIVSVNFVIHQYGEEGKWPL